MSISRLARATRKLTVAILGRNGLPGVLAGPYATQPHYAMYEGCLHELAHHVVINQGWVPGRRKANLGDEIDELSLVVRMANEVDTLAVEHVASVMLGHEIPIEALVKDACDAGNIILIRKVDALGFVRESADDSMTVRLGELLAEEIQQILHRS